LRSGVKTTISKVLFHGLPELVYADQDCEHKGLEIYNFVYDRYADANIGFAKAQNF